MKRTRCATFWQHVYLKQNEPSFEIDAPLTDPGQNRFS